MKEEPTQSPFPGMDPYIETMHRWADFHIEFLVRCRELLNEQLPRNYIATLGERIELISDPDLSRRTISLGPDVSVSRDPGMDRTRLPSTRASSLTTLEPSTLPNDIEMLDLPRQAFIEVKRLPDENLVTDVEALSPSNKRAGSDDRLAYLAKRKNLLVHRVNLVEFDLLLNGARLPLLAPLPPADYFAFITHGPNWHESDVYSWTVRDPLPTLPVPLLPEDGAVPLDLGAAFRIAYEKGRFGRQVRYGDQLIQWLGEADRAWAREMAASRK
ncbi:MAG TPA: DUF4058 family protein [Tepidisphaeraceae bacterium]|jgi:hypothetical protein|nr:DUF4058 family protein [Tepidisphaeraceae bacterium]